MGSRQRILFFAGVWILVFGGVLFFGLKKPSPGPSEDSQAPARSRPYSKERVTVLPRRSRPGLSKQGAPSPLGPSAAAASSSEDTETADTFRAHVTGRLVTPHKDAVPFQQICIAWKDEQGFHEKRVVTNSEGEFHLDAMEPGVYWWASSLRGGETSCEGRHPYEESQSFLVDAEDLELGELVWTLPAYAAIIRGQVLTKSGEVAAGCEVLLRDVQNTLITHTDAQGRFEFSRLFPDSYDLFARSEGGLSRAEKITPRPGETKTLTLTLSQAQGAIEGRVFGSDRAPLSGLTVVLRQPGKGDDPNGPYDELLTKTLEDGRFRFDRLPPGLYKVEFQLKARLLKGPDFQIIPEKTTVLESIHLKPSQD